MLDLCRLILGMVIDLLRSRTELEAEILVLRQQINVLRRTRPRRPPFISIDRLILGGVCRLFPKVCDALAIVRPDTVIRWFQIVLALEIESPPRPEAHRNRRIEVTEGTPKREANLAQDDEATPRNARRAVAGDGRWRGICPAAPQFGPHAIVSSSPNSPAQSANRIFNFTIECCVGTSKGGDC
jgi:hypothetical protein